MLERDLLFTGRIRASREELGLPVIDVDGSESIWARVRQVEELLLPLG